jgi:hypothetical protein
MLGAASYGKLWLRTKQGPWWQPLPSSSIMFSRVDQLIKLSSGDDLWRGLKFIHFDFLFFLSRTIFSLTGFLFLQTSLVLRATAHRQIAVGVTVLGKTIVHKFPGPGLEGQSCRPRVWGLQKGNGRTWPARGRPPGSARRTLGLSACCYKLPPQMSIGHMPMVLIFDTVMVMHKGEGRQLPFTFSQYNCNCPQTMCSEFWAEWW